MTSLFGPSNEKYESDPVKTAERKDEFLTFGDAFHYSFANDPLAKNRTRVPVIYHYDGESLHIGDYDVDGGYIEGRGEDRHRISPATFDKVIKTWSTPSTVEDWKKWFKENASQNMRDGSPRQSMIELGELSPDHHNKAQAAADDIAFYAEVDLLYYQVMTGLARPSTMTGLATVSSGGLRAHTVQATTQRAIAAGQVLSQGQVGARGEQIAATILRNSGNIEKFVILKNSSNHGIDIAAKTYSGKWIFYEVKTLAKSVAPALKELQRAGGNTFVRRRLGQIATKTGTFKKVSDATALNAQSVLNEIGSRPVDARVIQITNLGKATQSINIVPWRPVP